MQKIIRHSLALALALALPATYGVFAQQSSGTLRGQVVDEFGGLILGATVTAVDPGGVQKTVTSDNQGNYVFSSLAPGRYTVRATAPGFAAYENTNVNVTAGRTAPLNIPLSVAVEQAEVTVTAEAPLSTEPENNAGAVVLRGADLDALPDNPDDLADALQALAGPSAGPNGGQVYIDGFTDGRLPPKESIREIRINQNPFSAEYDRLGYGRIEIFTKPGTERFRGQGFFNFNNQALNSRNPFAPVRVPSRDIRYGGNLSGPIAAKRASFFLDFERRDINGNAIINATILDPLLNIVPFSQTVLTPTRHTTFSPRIDYQLNQKNTLVGRYTYARTSSENAGVGNFSLASRAFNTSSNEHTVQLTETAVLSQKVINETRFQYIRRRSNQNGDNTIPTINVLEAFTGGGAQVGLAFNNEDRWELQNYTSFSVGRHAIKAGGRLRGVHITNASPSNFGGTFTFAGGLAPALDANNQAVVDPATGRPVLVPITSIERYRRTLLFQRQGLSPSQIRALGGGATQFSIAGGNPQAKVSQVDFGGFLQDDWRMRPNFTLSLGLRYETQSNIHDWTDFGPRVAFAWSPGAGGTRQQKTVIRGGLGIFYDRFSESLTLQAHRFNGTNQQQFVVTDPAILNLFPTVPAISTLAGLALPQTIRRVEENLRAPYTMEAAISLERQLPYRFTLSATFISSRTLHVLRSRNINAPLPGTSTPGVRESGVRPFGNAGNIFEYESSGRFNQNQLIISANNRLNRGFTLWATYVLSKAMSDTDGPNTFPANQYDLSGEYGRSILDLRHRLFLGGSVRAPWGIGLSPFITANSSRPFNITVGRDINGDTLFTDRPALATDLTRPGVIITRFGAFDPNPGPGEVIIPRNFGSGPGFVSVNLRVSKTFGFGEVRGTTGAPPQGGGRGGRGGRGGGGGGPFGAGRGGGFGDMTAEKRYNLTFSVFAQNLFNHTNPAAPIGNLSSPLFGVSNATAGRYGFGESTAGNRRIEAQVRFSF